MLFCPRQTEVVQTGDFPTSFAISCQVRAFAALAARIAEVTSSRVMPFSIHSIPNAPKHNFAANRQSWQRRSRIQFSSCAEVEHSLRELGFRSEARQNGKTK